MRVYQFGWRSEMLQSKRITLRAIEAEDINHTYLGWMNDPSVNRYLETRFMPQSIRTIRTYWEKHKDDESNPWFAICTDGGNKHIGNIKLGPISWIHRRADISLFIGEPTYWGKGYGSEAIGLVRDWAFEELNLQKLNAGIYSNNVGSRNAFEKCGFVLEGTLKDNAISEGKRVDVWKLGLPRSMWRN